MVIKRNEEYLNNLADCSVSGNFAEMMKRQWLVVICETVACVAKGQVQGVVVDMSTGVPQRDVVIYTNHNEVDTTDWRGEYRFREPFDWAEARHPRFLSRKLTADEMRADTVRLIPLVNELSEVVITAKRLEISPAIMNGVNAAIAAGAAEAPRGLVNNLDLLAPLARFDRSRRWVSKKERRRQKEILDNY